MKIDSLAEMKIIYIIEKGVIIDGAELTAGPSLFSVLPHREVYFVSHIFAVKCFANFNVHTTPGLPRFLVKSASSKVFEYSFGTEDSIQSSYSPVNVPVLYKDSSGEKSCMPHVGNIELEMYGTEYLPEERGMTLVELRQIAARQQHQIEAQQHLLVAKEQRLKFLKQQEARHHALSEQQLETNCLLSLREKVQAQELKLRQLRALRGQVDQQKTNNGNLGTELESIRALFCEKEKELDLAVSKVEELTRQLDEIRNNSRKSCLQTSCSELENLRRELLYRTKLSEQQNNYICQQREKIACKQQEISSLDQKINDLNKRLHRKRLLNDQFASQVHAVSVSRNSGCSELSSGHLLKNESRSQELLDLDHSQDDFSAKLLRNHNSDLGGFSLNKKDPKYQTLPYNTKFTLKDKQSEDSSSTEDESWTPDKKDVPALPKSENGASQGLKVTPAAKEEAPAATNESQRVSPPKYVEAPIIPKKPLDAVPSPDVSSKNISSEPVVSKIASIKPSVPLPKCAKPAVPPKPAISVKPMISAVKKDQAESDSVNKALTFLKNKSSEKEKNEFRHSSSAKEPDPLLPKSRILTYFSKTLLQPEGSPQEPIKRPEHVPVPKRKSTLGQLPIKPKPLTIRKTPGIEPPKLKVPVATLTPYRKIVESNSIPSQLKITKKLPSIKTEEKSATQPALTADGGEAGVSAPEPEPEKACSASPEESNDGGCEVKEKDEEADRDEVFSSDEVDLIAEGHQSGLAVFKTKKGNLKCEGTIRGSRRVSFDPLALLLDAALEGELELVIKTAREVVNPSAANDEGITALHNAICAGHFDVVKFLVEFGCDVNAQDSDGWTPLHCAASCNNLAMVKFLVEKGACIFATTLSDQETAAEKCEEDEEGFDGCSEYLYSLQESLGIINNGVVFAVYDYDGQNADELSFKNGNALTILRRADNEENEWWWSRLNDEEGYVPRNLLGLYPRVNCVKNEKAS